MPGAFTEKNIGAVPYVGAIALNNTEVTGGTNFNNFVDQCVFNEQDYRKTGDVATWRNNNSQVVGKKFYDQHESWQCTLVISAASIANRAANGHVHLVEIGEKVTVSSNVEPDNFQGDWSITEIGMSIPMGDVTTVEVFMERDQGITNYTPIAA